MEKISSLRPAFIDDGTVTAATSSPLTDGAAATLVCSDEFAEYMDFNYVTEIVSTAIAGVDPEYMGYGPVPASQLALARANINIDDLDVIELNEAFSSQALACMHGLGLNEDDERINIDGGAIAIGHPLGASGCRITGKACSLLNRVQGEYALATMCIGGGMGISTVLRHTS